MGYQCNVALIIPRERFDKLYAGPFKNKRSVAVERAPFIDADKSSQVSYLRWMSKLENVARGDREHIAEVVDLFSDPPFDVLCVRCGKEKAGSIVLAYQPTYQFENDVSYTPFPFFCGGCKEYVGARTFEFPINFDNPFTRMENTHLGRRDLLRDLKRLLYFGFEDGPRELLDPREVISKMRQMEREKGYSPVINMVNSDAKRIANMLHHLKRVRAMRRTGTVMAEMPDGTDFMPQKYKERRIAMIQRGGGRVVADELPLFANI
jgi:hypothetical protein